MHLCPPNPKTRINLVCPTTHHFIPKNNPMCSKQAKPLQHQPTYHLLTKGVVFSWRFSFKLPTKNNSPWQLLPLSTIPPPVCCLKHLSSPAGQGRQMVGAQIELPGGGGFQDASGPNTQEAPEDEIGCFFVGGGFIKCIVRIIWCSSLQYVLVSLLLRFLGVLVCFLFLNVSAASCWSFYFWSLLVVFFLLHAQWYLVNIVHQKFSSSCVWVCFDVAGCKVRAVKYFYLHPWADLEKSQVEMYSSPPKLNT